VNKENRLKGEHVIVYDEPGSLDPPSPRLVPVFDLSKEGANTLLLYLSPAWARYKRDKAPFIYKSGAKTFIAAGPIITSRTKRKCPLFHDNVYQYKPTTILEDVSKLDVAAVNERLAEHTKTVLSKFKA